MADLFALEEFAAYLQVDLADLKTATVELLRDLAAGLIAEIATFEDDVYPVRVKAIALAAVARPYSNPEGLQSITETVGAVNGTKRWDAGQLGVYLTDAERIDIRGAAGISSSRALWTLGVTKVADDEGTIYVPTGPAPSGYPFPWYADDVTL